MKSHITIFLFLFVAYGTIAQTPFEQIIKAENKFEKDCLEMGIKKGFLANLDSTAIAFTKGKIENARKFWLSLPDFPGIYSWAPTYAEVSVSGDWGYTTGAVEYRDSSVTDKPSTYNQYTTVWQKNNKGDWKYLTDIGNTHGPVKIDRIPVEIKTKKVPVRNLTKQVILDQEKLYSNQFSTNYAAAMKKFYSRNFILNISGYPAVTNIDTAVLILKTSAANLSFEPVDVRLSPSNDMAVVSGYLIHVNQRKHYMRIWRHETPAGWKIALEVAKL